MKKSVRIRKAGPNETPGYYNKTAKFLQKAQIGMQVDNNLQDKLKVIMLDTYTAVRDGADPQEVFRKLLMDYGMPQEMAYKVMQTVMTKLAKDGYADPAMLEQDEEEQTAQAPQQQSEPAAPMAQNQNVGTPDEDEELALSEVEGDSGYDAMDYYNDRSMEQQEEQELSKYGGPLRKKLKRAQEGMQQPSEEEMMMQQQGQPQQQGGGDQMQQIMQQVGQALQQGARPEEIIAQLLQGQIPPEAIMQIFVEFGMGEEQVGQIIQSVIQQLQGGQEQQMSQEEMMRYGGSYNDGGEYDNYFDEESTPEDTVIDQYSNPGQLSMEQKAPMSIEAMLRSFNLPNSTLETPDLNAYLQGMYNYQNVGSDDIPNDLLPSSQAMYGGEYSRGGASGPGGGRKGRRKKKKESTTTETTETTVETPEVGPTIRIEPQESVANPSTIQKLQNYYYSKNMLAPQRGAIGTAAQILGTGLNYIRPQNWAESSKAFGLIGGREGVDPATTATKTYEDIYKILMDKDYKPETLIDNGDKTYSTGLAFNMGPQLYDLLTSAPKTDKVWSELNKSGSVQLELPTSKVPELNFLSLHNKENKTRLRLSLDNDGTLKATLTTFVDTKLKGLDKKTLVIKDEFYIDPETKTIIDPRTGMPLEMIQKSYYKGNELNWYNQAGTVPFTKKYGSGFDYTGYPEVVSSDPLKKNPSSRWNALTQVGLGLGLTPYILPFTYPGFAARNKFYPNADKITVDYFGRQRPIGPSESPLGMTFGDQPFGAQYSDYNLQANRNYLTGRNFMIGAGLVGAGLGGGYLYYNRDSGDMEVGSEQQNYIPPTITNPGFGYTLDLNEFGRKRPAVDYKENNYGLDSMYIKNGDTIHDKGWGVLAPDYKAGGAHKKKFLKRMQQMFEPGGEAQDPSLGKGSRMDNLNGDVAKKKSWIGALKQQSDKAANEELYDLVQKSGDPQLMNIFMGNDQSTQGMQQPMQNRMMAEGGDPCPEGSYWDEYKGECVPYSQGVPSREDLFNSPEMLDYLNKLNRKRNVQDYKDYRKDKIREYREQNYKGPMLQHEDGTPYPDRDSPEWKEFQNSEEFQNFINSYPNPDYDKRFQFPNDYKQKDYYPQKGDWDEKSKEEYNRLFNLEPEKYEKSGINMDIYIQQHPELRQQLEELREQQKWEEEEELRRQIYESIPEEEKNRNPSPQDLRKDRYNDWCPCYKTQEIIVQGQPVQHKICVPCEQAQVGGYVNMNAPDPLTRFVYGGNEPDYYEQDNLPEARDGVGTPPIMKYNEWFKDYTSQDNWPGAFAGNEPGDNTLSTDPNEATAYHQWMQEFNNPSPEAEEKRFDAYQNYLNFRNEDDEDQGQNNNDFSMPSPKVGETNSQYLLRTTGNPGFYQNNDVWDGTKWVKPNAANTDSHNCPPGSVWVEKYQQCVPIMQIKYNPRVVRGQSSLYRNLVPWNPIIGYSGTWAQPKGLPFNLQTRNPYTGELSGPPIASYVTRRGRFGRPKESFDIYNIGNKGVNLLGLKELIEENQNRGRYEKEKSSKEKSTKEKTGPREVRFSGPAMKYKLNPFKNKGKEKEPREVKFPKLRTWLDNKLYEGYKYDGGSVSFKDDYNLPIASGGINVPSTPMSANATMGNQTGLIGNVIQGPNTTWGAQQYFNQANNPVPTSASVTAYNNNTNNYSNSTNITTEPPPSGLGLETCTEEQKNDTTSECYCSPEAKADPKDKRCFEGFLIGVENTYKSMYDVDPEAGVNAFNAGARGVLGAFDRIENNKIQNELILASVDPMRSYATSKLKDRGDQVDYGTLIGYRTPEQGQNRSSRATYGNYSNAKLGGFLQNGGLFKQNKEVYMTPKQLEDFLRAGGEVDYI